jgi:hypothetical protein
MQVDDEAGLRQDTAKVCAFEMGKKGVVVVDAANCWIPFSYSSAKGCHPSKLRRDRCRIREQAVIFVTIADEEGCREEKQASIMRVQSD